MSTSASAPAFTLSLTDDLVEQTIELIECLTAISSATGDQAGLDAAALILGASLEDAGLNVVMPEPAVMPELAGVSDREWLLTASTGQSRIARPLLVVGHLDTVLPAWQPSRQDGQLSASGAADMKGGLAVLVGALHLLRRLGKRPPNDLLVVIMPDEEVLGPVTRWAMQHYGATARGLWVLEPGKRAEAGRETIVGRRRGMLHWRLDVRGRGAHAGNAFWQGRSALNAATAWSTAAAGLARPGDGPSINPGRLLAGDKSFVDNVANHAHLLGTAAQINIVPDRALVEGEARFLQAEDGEQLVENLRRLTRETARSHNVTAAFEASPLVPPLVPHPDGTRWAEQAVALAAAADWELEIETSRGGLSFPNFLPDPGGLPVLDGLGPAGDGLHTRGEFVDLTSVARRIGLLAALLDHEAGES